MANWSKRMFEAGPAQVGQWFAVQRAFEASVMRLVTIPRHCCKPPRDARHVEEPRQGRDLVDGSARPCGLYGFSSAHLSEIPRKPILLVGDAAGYDELFGAGRRARTCSLPSPLSDRFGRGSVGVPLIRCEHPSAPGERCAEGSGGRTALGPASWALRYW